MKSQISIELLSMMGMAAILSLVLIVAFASYASDKYDENAYYKMKDLGLSLQQEVILAAQLEEGYTRLIQVPDRLDSIEYTISYEHEMLKLSYKDKFLLFRMPNTTGHVKKGVLNISNINGEIVIE